MFGAQEAPSKRMEAAHVGVFNRTEANNTRRGVMRNAEETPDDPGELGSYRGNRRRRSRDSKRRVERRDNDTDDALDVDDSLHPGYAFDDAVERRQLPQHVAEPTAAARTRAAASLPYRLATDRRRQRRATASMCALMAGTSSASRAA
jgi:hypothetical protein